MRRSLRMLAVLTFLTGGLAPALIALTPGVASAGACGTPVTAGSNCTLTGTLNLTGGTLAVTTPSSLAWIDTLNGLNQSVVDATTGDQQYTVDDATGTGAGWHITMSGTTFTSGSHTLPDTGTFSTNGSTISATGTTAPTAMCTATCSLPNDSTTYPVAITTAASSPTPYTIYDTALNSGLGQVVIGGSGAANPVGWWLAIPADVYLGTGGVYTSTITVAVVSAP